MRRMLLIARRDYVASVRTKAFLIGLLVAPLLFGGSFLATVLLKGHPSTQTIRIAIVDQAGMPAETIIKQLEQQNLRDEFDKRTGAQVMPSWKW